MAEWVVCPYCQLKHTRRPDGSCPRCKQAIDAGGDMPVAQPAAEGSDGAMPDVYDGRALSPTSPRPGHAAAGGGGMDTDTSDVPLGARIAGGILIVNGLLRVAETAVASSDGGFAAGPVSMVIDFLIGGSLLFGHPRFLAWAKVRIVLGGLILPIVFIATGSPLVALVQLIFSGGLALLVFGRASVPRIAAGAVVAGLYLAMGTLGLLGLTLGASFLRSAAYSSQLESAPLTILQGERYHLTPASHKWYLRKAEFARKDNPLSDRWIVRPDKDAHIFVIAEELPGTARVDMDRFTEAVTENARRGASKFELISNTPLSITLASRLLEIRFTNKGQEMHGYYGLFAREPYIYQVAAIISEKEFSGLSAELKQTVSSFELD
jgi:hypothetical protein